MPSHTLPAYDRIVPGGMEQWLRDRRAEGASLRAIVSQLREAHQIHASVETVRGWCREYGISTERQTKAASS